MPRKKSPKSVISALILGSILLAVSTNIVSASGGSIAMANTYPSDGETYRYIDHILQQTTAVNTNTTVSVSIDGGLAIPMTFQGILNEAISGDNVSRDWHTWRLSIPVLSTPGKHSVQFFSHYYVWQEVDKYWAEFDSYSEIKTFTIAGSSSASSQPLSIATTMNQTYFYAAIIIIPIVALLLIGSFIPQKRKKT
jgi:hypothetical protein